MNRRQAIKICGISSAETVDACVMHGASHIGLNFYPPSPRHIDMAQARELGAQAAGRVRKVGVFVDPPDDLLQQAIEAAALDAVQLHKVTAHRRAQVKQHFGIDVWAVIAIRTRADLATRNQIDPGTADCVLYDAATPDGANLPGGMGLRFDWSMMSGLSHPFPWGLAGGLTPENVAEAIRVTGALLVDTASGVESAPGVKDVDRIAAFCKAARNL